MSGGGGGDACSSLMRGAWSNGGQDRVTSYPCRRYEELVS